MVLSPETNDLPERAKIWFAADGMIIPERGE
jgi:hypothetical protein